MSKSSKFSKKELDELFFFFFFLPMVNYYFNSADTDKSGFIEKGEINKFLTQIAKEKNIDAPSDKDINETLKKFDTNKDGKLSKKEFEVLVKKLIREMLGV